MEPFSSMEECRLERGDYLGWQAIYLKNSLLTVAVVPDIGGRIMAYDLGEFPFLYVERSLAGKLFSAEENQGDGSLAAWKNYGGDKTWPAPQGWDNDNQWHGPPDPVLDSGRYQVINSYGSAESVVLEMVSPPDSCTGLQITRKLTLLRGSSRLILDLSFTNISERTINWSIWDVVQLRAELELPKGSFEPDTGCVVTTPVNANSRFPGGYSVMFGAEDNPQWSIDNELGLFIGRYLWEIGKVGLDSPGEWIAFCNETAGYAFTERFTYDPEANYPDNGATVECWTTGRGRVGNLNFEESPIYHMETEVLSPLYTMQPGEPRSFQIEWGACRLPGRVMDVQPAGCVYRPLLVETEGNQTRVHGVFGVFDEGELYLLCQDRAGKALFRMPLDKVSPLNVVVVDRLVQLSSRAATLELLVRTDVAGRFYPLAVAQVVTEGG